MIIFRQIAGAFVGGAVGGALLVSATPVVIGALGFSAGGIVGGTPAAWMMATYGGNVVAGSLLSVAQSIGAVGMGPVATATVAVAGTVSGSVAGEKVVEYASDD